MHPDITVIVSGGQGPDEHMTEAQAMAAGNMVEAREHTNQRLIALLMSRLEQLSRPEH